jgi:stage V sporulation protein AB
LLIFLGLAGGFMVGGGLVAFIVVLDIIPRLTHLTRTKKYLRWFESSIILGAVVWTWLDLHGDLLFLGKWIIVPLGLLMGGFIGMLAAALTEILNVFPILMKRVGLQNAVIIFLMAMAIGKVVGSLYQWIYFKVW